MAYTSGRCYCCEKERPVDNHHVAPLEYGGDRDGRQVKLCKSCHSLAHYEAEYYHKNGAFNQIDSTIPETSPMGVRLRKLIRKIVDTKLVFEDGGEQENDQRRMSAISWDSKEELAMAHEVKRALGFTALDRALKQCVYLVHQGLKNRGRI